MLPIELRTYLCGSLFGGLVVLFDVGGLVLLLYIDQSATRDISKAFNASLRLMQSGLCGPFGCKRENILLICSIWLSN